MISHQKKLVFIHVPKTGGKKISKYLQPYCDEESLRFSPFQKGAELHATVYDYLKYYGPEILDYDFYSIIRNPYDKAVSMYMDQNDNCYEKETFKKMIHNPTHVELWPHSHFYFYVKVEPPTIEIAPGNRQPAEHAIFRPCDAALLPLVDEMIVWPRVMRFENYSTSVAKFFDAVDIKYDPDDLKTKVNATTHEHYSHYYSQPEIDAIAYSCGLDLQVYGYQYAEEKR
jgi:hypothetical protein